MYPNETNQIIKIDPPKKTEIKTIRFLIICALICMIIFLVWFIKPEHIGYEPIYWALTFALLFKILKMIHEWCHYWNVSVPITPQWKTKWTVDILTTACPGEPKGMIIQTLEAMKAITYPHTNYLCDEGNDPDLKKVCEELGIIHVTRTIKINAKAGNINNALKQAGGDICVILDPDHVPIPEFLDRVLPYFEDQEIGYVQCVQAYGNQSESIIAKGAAEQTYHFYGPMMMSMNTFGTAQAIGANCTFRRDALDSIGGHAAGLSEDMHTAMQLHAKGWKSLYIPEILTRGLAPATLSAYYQQQLKWSRGTFELLFRTYPSLYKNFTWRQKLHYFTIPMYFLFGLINFIDILIPILALGLARVPWEVNINHFAIFFLPLGALSMLIRLYAQRWLLEKHERGFHLAGGLLRTATWWIFLIGFIYSIFNIKVPYIPTPKNDEQKNYWQLSIPNMLVSVICIISIIYGLAIDWTPYSMAMALYAGTNAAMLGFIILMSQQRFIIIIKDKIKKTPVANYLTVSLGSLAAKVQQTIYGMLRNGPIAVIVGVSLVFISSSSLDDETDRSGIPQQKEIGGFYSGVSLSNDRTITELNYLKNSLHTHFDIVSFKQDWAKENIGFPKKLMEDIADRGGIPMIIWEPTFESIHLDKNKICLAISSGNYDDYLKKCAASLRSYSQPVFINFAPGFDDPKKSWSLSGNNTPEEFCQAWQYAYTFFNNLGISNVTWVWNPKFASSRNYYPGSKFVDWIGVSCLNYGENLKDNDWYSFSEVYTPYRNSLGTFQKPVMITAFGSVAGPDQSLWINNALADIKKNYHEINSIVIYNKRQDFIIENKQNKAVTRYTFDFSIQQKAVLAAFDSNFKKAPFVDHPFLKNDVAFLTTKHTSYTSDFIKGNPGKFKMMIKAQPYYIRGVAYNTAHDWRDGNMPLTRRQLEKDFELIKAMGANTIRRYDDGVYDKNILNIAQEYDLKVVFGFWFDPKIDYYKDTLKVKEYMDNVEEKVLAYKDYPSVLAWSLGNETWGLLKHNYSKPYLIKVRQQYIKLIELLAQRIHVLDPNHPVFTSMEHEEYQLPGELVAFHDGAPSIDVIGINSFYKEQINKLNHVTHQFDSLRPYLISEFGPRGYWDPHYNRTSKGYLVEDNEIEKAEWYKEQWKNYVSANKGSNIGGFAYCWHDRMEGSYTWFGLTDYKGRPKPSYYALKELWTNQKEGSFPMFAIHSVSSFIPGNEYLFTATPSDTINKDLVFEWFLHKDEYLERVDNIEYSDNGRSARVTIPKEKSKYRLYLYVSDQEGNVTTASAPIQVK